MGEIVLEGVEKSFGATKVISNVNLTVEDGSFVVFVGPSGCGKSTLLRLIAGLEDTTGGKILIEIAKLQDSLGTTAIYVTHDQVEAMTMADKIVVLNAGRIEQVGSPLELYDHPANLFVAGFIGSPKMNLVSGKGAAEWNAA